MVIHCCKLPHAFIFIQMNKYFEMYKSAALMFSCFAALSLLITLVTSSSFAQSWDQMPEKESQLNLPDNTAILPDKHQNPFGIEAKRTEGLEDRAAALENFVYGKVEKKLPIQKRVQRLERKLVPYEHHNEKEDLELRLDHLWAILSAANKNIDHTY